MKIIKKLIYSILIVSILLLIVKATFIMYYYNHPLTAAIDRINFEEFSSDSDSGLLNMDYLNTEFNEAINGSSEFQLFYSGSSLPSDDPKDYTRIRITYKFTNKSYFHVSGLYLLINEIPEGDNSIIMSQCPFSEGVDRYSTSTQFTNIYIYKKGMSEEEILSTINNISFIAIFNRNREPCSLNIFCTFSKLSSVTYSFPQSLQ